MKNACSGTSSQSPDADLLEPADRLGERHVAAGDAGVLLGDEEGLREELLDAAGAGDDDLSSSESSSTPRIAMRSCSAP